MGSANLTTKVWLYGYDINDLDLYDHQRPQLRRCRRGASGSIRRRSSRWRSMFTASAAGSKRVKDAFNVTIGAEEIYDEGPLYEAAKKVYPQKVWGTYRRLKWIVLWVALGVYYVLPVHPLGSGAEPAGSGGPGRYRPFALLLLLHPALAAGGLLLHRPADPGRRWSCSCPTRCSAGCGAATPARRRSGPTSSSGSSA